MATEINKAGRIIHKHDIENNWMQATNFSPKTAELIIYDKDDFHDHPRFKIGDGTTNVNDLPFVGTYEVISLIHLTKSYTYHGIWNSAVSDPPKAGDFGWIINVEDGDGVTAFANTGDIVNVGTEDDPEYLIMIDSTWQSYPHDSIDESIFTSINNVKKDVVSVREDLEETAQTINEKIDNLHKAYESKEVTTDSIYLLINDSYSSGSPMAISVDYTSNGKVFCFSENLITSVAYRANESSTIGSCSVTLNDDGTISISNDVTNSITEVNLKLCVDDIKPIDTSKSLVFLMAARDLDIAYQSTSDVVCNMGWADGNHVGTSFNVSTSETSSLSYVEADFSNGYAAEAQYRHLNITITLQPGARCILYPILAYSNEMQELSVSADGTVSNALTKSPNMTIVGSDYVYSITATYDAIRTNSVTVQADYAENNENSNSYIKNRPFGDFGYDVRHQGSYYSIPLSNLTLFSLGGYPIYWQGCIDEIKSSLNINNYEDIVGLNMTVVADSNTLSGKVSVGYSASGNKYYYIGEVYIYDTPSEMLDTSKVLNFSSYANPGKLVGIAWSSSPDSNVCGGAPTIFYSLSLTSTSISSIYIDIPITRLDGKYLPKPTTINNTSTSAKFIIDDSSNCFYLMCQAGRTFELGVDTSLNNGEVKYLTISNLPKSTISSSNLRPTSLNGFTFSDINSITGSATMMIVKDDSLDDGYAANWYLFSSLPQAEDYTF